MKVDEPDAIWIYVGDVRVFYQEDPADENHRKYLRSTPAREAAEDLLKASTYALEIIERHFPELHEGRMVAVLREAIAKAGVSRKVKQP